MKYFLILLIFINSLYILSDTLTLQKNEINDTINLPYVIIDNSLQIQSETSVLKKNTDYQFSNGKIIFFDNNYSYLIIIFSPFDTLLKYSNHTFNNAITTDSVVTTKSNTYLNSNVRLGGVKGFMISVNNTGYVNINQSLELTINGNLNNNWILNGHIYDNNTTNYVNTYNIPITGIEDLYINISDSTNSFYLGNSTFNTLKGTFNNRNREIFGIAAQTHLSNYPINIATAGQKGKIKTKEFYCTYGIQGPYFLTEERVLTEYIITPNSENIFFNGEKLEKGKDKDYTINYQNGEIYFTSKRIVDNNTYIYAEFQTYENINPINGYYFLAGNDSSLINILFMREEQTPIDTSLISILKNIDNNDSNYVYQDNYQYVGDNNGNYILIDSFFEYAPDSGDYNVEFYFTGLGNGDYVYSPENNCYIYAGKNMGNYSVKQKIDLPFESNYMSMNFSHSLLRGILKIESGGGFYKYNKYSDDDYIRDISYEVKYLSDLLFYKSFSMSFIIKKIYLSDFYREQWIENNNDEIQFSNEIGITQGIENTNSFLINFNYLDYMKNTFTYSLLDSFTEKSIESNLLNINSFSIKLTRKTNEISDSVIYENNSIFIDKNINNIIPYYKFQKEDKDNKLYYRNHLGFHIHNNKFEYIREKIINYDTLYQFSNILQISSYANFLNHSLNANLEYRRTESQTTDNKLFSHINIIGKFSHINYNQSINLSSISNYIVEETYIFVGKGNGDFIYDSISGNYISDNYEGEYIRIMENVYTTEPVAQRNYSGSVNFDFSDFSYMLNANYDDNSNILFSVNNADINYFSSNFNQYSKYYFNDYLTTYWEQNFYKNNTIINSSYYTNSFKCGIFSISEFNYKIYYGLNFENRINNYSEEEIISKSANIEINTSKDRITYNIVMSYEDINENYSDSYYTINNLSILKNSIQPKIKFNISKNTYIKFSPQLNIITYSETIENIPISIYYKYPEGFSYNGNYSLVFYNNYVNIALNYFNEYTQKYLFKQRMEISIYSYF